MADSDSSGVISSAVELGGVVEDLVEPSDSSHGVGVVDDSDDDEINEPEEPLAPSSPSLAKSSSSSSSSELASSGSVKSSMSSVNSSALVVNLLGSVIIMGFAFAISHAWKLRRERRGENKTSAKRLAARSSKNLANKDKDKKKVDDKEKAKAAEKQKEKAPPPAPVPKEANKPEPAAAAPPASAPKPAAPAAPKTATQTTAPKPAAPAAPKTATQEVFGGFGVFTPSGVKKSCLFCGDDNPETHLLRCSVCKSVYFCSRACQRAAWPTHKAECNAKK